MGIDLITVNSGRYLDDNDVVHNVVDTTTGGFKTTDTDHAYIHAGGGFSFYNKFTLASGASAIVGFKSSSTKAIHFRPFNVATLAENVTIIARESAVYTGGTTIASNNHNRMSSVVSDCVISLAPTVTTQGNAFAEVYIGGGTGVAQSRIGGTSESSREWVLKHNTYYTITILNGSSNSNTIHLNAFWYEE